MTAPPRVHRARDGIRASCDRTGRDDAGFALVMAIGVTFVVLLLVVTVITVAVRSDVAAGHDRGRTQAVAAAEAGLDAAVLRVKDSAQDPQALCSTPTPPMTVWSSPGTSSVDVTYTFVTTSGPRTCSSLGSAVVTGVEVRSSATHTHGSTTAERTMSATVPLGDPPLPATRYAIFVQGDMVNGTSSNLPTTGSDVYLRNGDYSCGTSASVGGSVTVQNGSFEIGSSCVVGGSVQAAGDVVTGTSSIIRGSVSVWNGGVTLGTSARVDGSVTARNDVRVGTSATVGGTVRQRQPSVPTPAPVEMPRVTYRASDWQAHGFSTTAWSGSCTIGISRTLTITSRTVLDARSVCGSGGLQWNTLASLGVTADIAIFANAFASSSSARIFSADGKPHKVWLIVPAAETGAYCQSLSGNIDFGTSFAAQSPIALSLYGACSVTVGTSSDWNGQVWANTLSLATSSRLTYEPVGTPGVPVPGEAVAPPPAGGVVKSERSP